MVENEPAAALRCNSGGCSYEAGLMDRCVESDAGTEAIVMQHGSDAAVQTAEPMMRGCSVIGADGSGLGSVVIDMSWLERTSKPWIATPGWPRSILAAWGSLRCHAGSRLQLAGSRERTPHRRRFRQDRMEPSY